MKRSLQEIVELIVFGLIALLIGTGVLWLLGWLFGIVGIVFKFIAGLIWMLLRFIIPIAIVAGVVYFIVRMLTKPKNATPAVVGGSPQMGSSSTQTITVDTAPKAESEHLHEAANHTTTEAITKVVPPQESVQNVTNAVTEATEPANTVETAETETETVADTADITDNETSPGSETDDKKDA